MELRPGNNEPLYLQLKKILRTAIVNGEYVQGQQIPTEQELMKRYDVRQCYYGHLHGASHGLAMEGQWDGIEYNLVAADKIGFRPFLVIS